METGEEKEWKRTLKGPNSKGEEKAEGGRNTKGERGREGGREKY